MYRFSLFDLIRLFYHIISLILIIVLLLHNDNNSLHLFILLNYLLFGFMLERFKSYDIITFRRLNGLGSHRLLEFRHDGLYRKLYCRIHGDLFWHELSSDLYTLLVRNDEYSINSNKLFSGRLISYLESGLIEVTKFRYYLENKFKI